VKVFGCGGEAATSRHGDERPQLAQLKVPISTHGPRQITRRRTISDKVYLLIDNKFALVLERRVVHPEQGSSASSRSNLLILKAQRTDIIRAGIRGGDPPLSARRKPRDRSSRDA
jgi:hypothetical protein